LAATIAYCDFVEVSALEVAADNETERIELGLDNGICSVIDPGSLAGAIAVAAVAGVAQPAAVVVSRREMREALDPFSWGHWR
jgi:hypothetical protein